MEKPDADFSIGVDRVSVDICTYTVRANIKGPKNDFTYTLYR